jgi:hypothetical protein
MHVKFSSDGNVPNSTATGAHHQGFAAVYSTSDPLSQIRDCELGEVTLAYGDGSTRFCGVAGNGVGGARPFSRVVHLGIVFEPTAIIYRCV